MNLKALNMFEPENYKNLIVTAAQAGDIILDTKRQHALEIDYKENNTPVTLADYRANEHIINKLRNYYPNIPIISEEIDNSIHNSPNSFFLIDPLDGTRDFIEGSPDYCVNIALIYNNVPVFGVIYLPESHECYYAITNKGSFKIHNCHDLSKQEKITVRKETKAKIQTISKRSNQLGYHAFDPNITLKDTLYMGSAKKFCAVAEGLADIYPRSGRTGEWDTAAGDILVTEAGGFVRDKANKPLVYGKKDYLNGCFYASNFVLENSDTV